MKLLFVVVLIVHAASACGGGQSRPLVPLDQTKDNLIKIEGKSGAPILLATTDTSTR